MLSTSDVYHFPDQLDEGKPYFNIQMADAAIHHFFPGAEAQNPRADVKHEDSLKYFPRRKNMKYFKRDRRLNFSKNSYVEKPT